MHLTDGTVHPAPLSENQVLVSDFSTKIEVHLHTQPSKFPRPELEMTMNAAAAHCAPWNQAIAATGDER